MMNMENMRENQRKIVESLNGLKKNNKKFQQICDNFMMMIGKIVKCC